ncbi:hypothetical protein M1N18_00365 [Dehalococcoidales bacterium]|nr:hypothetical protein [Dehalococcoidales bacterium]MCL0052905.1 hypothetical protein [Dehalococcoidales bacterium]
MARIEGAFEQMGKRLNHIESEIRELRGEIRSLYRTMIIILIPMWVTIMGAIIGLALAG